MKYWEDCTKEQQIERWEQCLRVLKALPAHERRKHWDMANWGIKTECGTVACAAGHCGLDPWFRRRGLRLVPVSQRRATDKAGNGLFAGFEFAEDAPDAFFGYAGSMDIFFNAKKRPVSQVIKEVRAYIKELKATA